MTVTRAKALEAASVLRIQLDDATEAMVKTAFRSMALTAHPDQGGSVEAYARVDWAKEVLNRWLKAQATVTDTPGLTPDKCKPCGGRGSVVIRRGFGTLTITCGLCRGSGDATYDHDRSDHYEG